MFFNNSEIAAKLCGRLLGDCVNYAGTKIFSRYVLVFFIGKTGVHMQLGLPNEIKKAKNVQKHWQESIELRKEFEV